MAIIPSSMVHSCFEASAPIYIACLNGEERGNIVMFIATGVIKMYLLTRGYFRAMSFV
jgi:hypothetical protein